MDVFHLRKHLIKDYSRYIQSFIQILNPRIRQLVDESIRDGLLWPEPLIQLNPSFEPGQWIDELVQQGVLHEECGRIFRAKSDEDPFGKRLRLHRHQSDAVRTARTGASYVLTTGTGSGKSLAYIIPIVDNVLREGSGHGVRAIVVYPMNALANSQLGELEKFLCLGYPDGRQPVRFARYTGQESQEDRRAILESPPDIILTNYVMLELMLTRPAESPLIAAAQDLQFLVLDELHTYRGRQGADVAMLVRRVRDRLGAEGLQCVGTSATLAGPGTFEEQRKEVARVASQLFGVDVLAGNVIGETLRRATPERTAGDAAFGEELRSQVREPDPPGEYKAFTSCALASWIESTFGVAAEPGGRLVRARPRSITGAEGAAALLATNTELPVDDCASALEQWLLAGCLKARDPQTGFPAFAFRLHQFISRGDTVYSSLAAPPEEPYRTVQRQRYVPGHREKLLLPLVFCRECGQEYYTVSKATGKDGLSFQPRDWPGDEVNAGGEAGFLYLSQNAPWPFAADEVLERLPEHWLETNDRGITTVKKSRRKDVPQCVRLRPDGKVSEDGIECHYFPAPFRFCLNCGVSYGITQTNDFQKIAVLGSEGRSTATTVLSLSAVQMLRNEEDLAPAARKLLSFTDNRQDASLQAGHFNDFVQIGLLRAALYRAVSAAGSAGIQHEQLAQKVFDALALPLREYALDPQVQYHAKTETERALREVVAYRLYADLKRGWRIVSPNLEQCGLLRMDYQSLGEMCANEDLWKGCHAALQKASPELREYVARVLLDYMRRELAIKVDYLDARRQEQIQQLSSQHLKAPWAVDENEQMRHSALLYPRSHPEGARDENVYLSARGGFGQYLRRKSTFPDPSGHLGLDDCDTIIGDLLDALAQGILLRTDSTAHSAAGQTGRYPRRRDGGDGPCYQLMASAMLWVAGDGRQAFHDVIRVPNEAATGGRTNEFFVDFYRNTATALVGLEAREHTAQVPYEARLKREQQFREGSLPVLYCSPTMELGVDIKELNVVSLRNVPPTPANYAQRSGRAGRSGQPALVFTYCAKGSSHDQYFFKRPELMVAGAVAPPRLDLANEDLVTAHVHSIWLAETRQDLGRSLAAVLDLNDTQALPLQDAVRQCLEMPAAQHRARACAARVLRSPGVGLDQTGWFSEGWLDDVLRGAVHDLNAACDRWRDLFRAALDQAQKQQVVILDHTRSQQDKQTAIRLRKEAEEQHRLLTEEGNLRQSDFYSYRYFASEGFLPGYSFPRLPLSAYIPARRAGADDEFLQRARFLAISEFGPQAFIYHEGSRYQVNRVILPPSETDGLRTRQAKLCPACGYLHPGNASQGADVCDRCGAELSASLVNLFRMQNVTARQRQRITSDEEERMRRGYQIVSGVRFSDRQGTASFQTARAQGQDGPLVDLTYGHAATLWRINLGWAHRKAGEGPGFMLDVERGYWAKRNDDEPDDETPGAPRAERVIPFVEDSRHCLLLEPGTALAPSVLASLGAALSMAIQAEFQLEDSELATERLPTGDNPRLLLFYEAAEGGAGVLRRLVEEPDALPRVCRKALELCHFDPKTGEDLRRAPRAKEDCEAACYDCLMSYFNQIDHPVLDRQTIRDMLMALATSQVEASPAGGTRQQHLVLLERMAGSDLERKWLRFINERGYSLPEKAQVLIEKCGARPDFLYHNTAVYIDGPHHAFPGRRERDRAQETVLEDAGYTVIRFGLQDDWRQVCRNYSWIFGEGLPAVHAVAPLAPLSRGDVIFGSEDDPGAD